MYYYRFRIKNKPNAEFFCSKKCHTDKMKKDPNKKTRKLSSTKRSVQNVVNKYSRLRDCAGEDGTNCISCNKWFPYEKGDGGHFIPMGSSSALRYDERNINFQCHGCNRFKHGNQANYYVGMVNKYGQPVVDELMSRQHETRKWSDDELKELRKHYNAKIKLLESGSSEDNPGMAVQDMFKDMD